MHSVKSTTAWLRGIITLFFTIFIYTFSFSQDNSPYSRYGVGDVVPDQNIINRGMGGIAAGYSDLSTADLNNVAALPKYDLSINLKNPASLGSLINRGRFSNTIFDLGGEIDFRTLKSTSLGSKYRSTNTIFSYFQVAFPIASKKMEKKGINWGLSFGLRPVTRIGYKVEKNERLSGIDSLNTLYEGSGGVNQFNLGTGFRIKNFSFGFTSGYTFANRSYSTEKVFINDTVIYYKSHTEAQSHFGGIFLDAGIQYMIPLKGNSFIKLGAYANFQQKTKGKQDKIDETFAFDGNGGIVAIDTVEYKKASSGNVVLPATYGFGFTYNSKNGSWLTGADVEMTSWDNYRYFGQTDNVQNNLTIRAGAEYYPLGNRSTTYKYWQTVKYRAGFYVGPDYIKLDQTRTSYAATLGASLPLTELRRIKYGEYVRLNTSLEIGGRGNKSSLSFRENTLRLSIGLSMNARWFQKRSYQ